MQTPKSKRLRAKLNRLERQRQELRLSYAEISKQMHRIALDAIEIEFGVKKGSIVEYKNKRKFKVTRICTEFAGKPALNGLYETKSKNWSKNDIYIGCYWQLVK